MVIKSSSMAIIIEPFSFYPFILRILPYSIATPVPIGICTVCFVASVLIRHTALFGCVFAYLNGVLLREGVSMC